MKKTLILLAFLAAACTAPVRETLVTDPADYVSTLVGTLTCSSIIFPLDPFCLFNLFSRCPLPFLLESIEQYDHLIPVKDEESPVNVSFKLCPQLENPLLDILHMLGR